MCRRFIVGSQATQKTTTSAWPKQQRTRHWSLHPFLSLDRFQTVNFRSATTHKCLWRIDHRLFVTVNLRARPRNCVHYRWRIWETEKLRDWPPGHMVTWSHGHMVTWWHGDMVTWWHGDMVTIYFRSDHDQGAVILFAASTVSGQLTTPLPAGFELGMLVSM